MKIREDTREVLTVAFSEIPDTYIADDLAEAGYSAYRALYCRIPEIAGGPNDECIVYHEIGPRTWEIAFPVEEYDAYMVFIMNLMRGSYVIPAWKLVPDGYITGWDYLSDYNDGGQADGKE